METFFAFLGFWVTSATVSATVDGGVDVSETGTATPNSGSAMVVSIVDSAIASADLAVVFGILAVQKSGECRIGRQYLCQEKS